MAGGEWIKEMIVNLTMDPKNKKRQAYRTLDSDLDYDIQTRSMNWPLFGGRGWGGGGGVESGDDSPVTMLSPFAIHKGFQALIPGRLRSIKRLRNF